MVKTTTDRVQKPNDHQKSGNGVGHRCPSMLFILNICTVPTRSSAARMRISVTRNRTHEKRAFALTSRVRSSLLFPQSRIDFWRNGNSHLDGCRPPREVYAQLCAMFCAFQIQLHQGTLMNLVPRTQVCDILEHARVERSRAKKTSTDDDLHDASRRKLNTNTTRQRPISQESRKAKLKDAALTC